MIGFSALVFPFQNRQDSSIKTSRAGFTCFPQKMNSQLNHTEEQATILQVQPVPSTDTNTATLESEVANSENTTEAKVRVEEFTISGDYLITKIKNLLNQGNIRRIIVKNAQGRTLLDLPMVAGVVGGVVGVTLFPVAAAITAIASMVAHLTVTIERKE